MGREAKRRSVRELGLLRLALQATRSSIHNLEKVMTAHDLVAARDESLPAQSNFLSILSLSKLSWLSG
jgi:hypothetical protein